MHLLLILRKWLASLIAADRIWGYRSSVGSLALRSIRMLDSAKLQGWIGLSHFNVQKRLILKACHAGQRSARSRRSRRGHIVRIVLCAVCTAVADPRNRLKTPDLSSSSIVRSAPFKIGIDSPSYAVTIEKAQGRRGRPEAV